MRMPEAPGTESIGIASSEVAPGIFELKIDGSLDWSNYARVEAAIAAIFARNCYRIVVNLKDARYISSAGFGCFIGSLDTCTKNGGDLIFASTPAEIQDVFNILGLAKILRFADTTQSALTLLKR
jgi:anti-anti-sigma factor